MMKLPRPLLLCVCLAALTTNVQAHGKKDTDADEETAGAAAEIDREQRDWGVAAAPSEASRKVQVSMDDTMRFTPAEITVAQGETVTFSVANEGKLLHEFVLGTPESIDEHAAMMKKYPGMQHAEPFMAHVSPGESSEITWSFNRGGTVKFACLVAGHYEAGMVGAIDVESSTE